MCKRGFGLVLICKEAGGLVARAKCLVIEGGEAKGGEVILGDVICLILESTDRLSDCKSSFEAPSLFIISLAVVAKTLEPRMLLKCFVLLVP